MGNKNLRKYKEISISKMRRSERYGVICFGVGLMMMVMGLPFGIDAPTFISSAIIDGFIRIGLWLVVCVFATILHEGLHGLFFWRFTGKVKFGFKLWSETGPIAYATSLNSILSKHRMMMVTIAPQILTIVLLMLIGLVGLPNLLRYGLLNMAAFNLGGGCFDLYFIFLVLKEKGKIFVEDTMTGVVLYKE